MLKLTIEYKFKPKFIIHSYIANWFNCKLYPRIWYNKSKNPGFKHNSIALRWLWWYWGIQKIYKTN